MFTLFFCLLLDSTEEEKYFRACISELTSRTNQSMLPGDCREYNAAHLYSRLSDNGEFPSFTFSPRKKNHHLLLLLRLRVREKDKMIFFLLLSEKCLIFPLWLLLPRNLELRGPRKLIANSRRLIFSSGGGNRGRRQQRHYNMISLALNTE